MTASYLTPEMKELQKRYEHVWVLSVLCRFLNIIFEAECISQENDLNVDYLQPQKFAILIRISKSSMAKLQTYKWGKVCDSSAVLLTDHSLAGLHLPFRCHFLQQEWIASQVFFPQNPLQTIAGLSCLTNTNSLLVAILSWGWDKAGWMMTCPYILGFPAIHPQVFALFYKLLNML